MGQYSQQIPGPDHQQHIVSPRQMNSRKNKTQKVLRLLHILQRGPASGSKLAAEMDTGLRNIERYIRELRLAL